MSVHSESTLNPRYAALFDPVRIGPVTAPNRFYQVPHASGMTNALPHVRARFRETNISFDVMATGPAVRTYNVMFLEGRRVGAGLIAAD